MSAGRDSVLDWLDVLVMGPYVVYTALGVKNKYFRTGLAVVGIATVALAVYKLRQSGDDDAGAAPPAGAALGRVPGAELRRRFQLARTLRTINR